jgi:hypothetical protein
MEPAFIEFLLFALLLAALYKILRPLQRRLEAALHNFLDPKHQITDAEIVQEEKRKKHKE